MPLSPAPCCGWGRIPPFLSLAGVRHCGHLEATLSAPVEMERHAGSRPCPSEEPYFQKWIDVYL